MTVSRGVRTLIEHFDRAQVYSSTPGQNGWTIKDTSAAGAPTYLNVTEDGGAAKLTLAAEDEAEIVTLFHNDVLMFDPRMIQNAWFIAKVADISAVTTLVFGLATEQNDAADSVAEHAWFRMEGSVSTSAVVVETDDGANDINDVATGQALGSTYKKCLIDFTNGLGDVRFFIDGQRVAAGTKFDMSALEAGHNVQPFVQLQKSGGATTPSITIAQFGIQYSWAYGA